MTVKLAALLAVPSEVVTLIGPLVAPAGTVAVIAVAEPTVKLELVPLNSTALAPVKLVPLIVTLAPTGPLPGVKLVMVGGLALETVMVTLAVTGTLPLTVDPSAEAVVVTIRLPSNCAWAGCGASKLQPIIADSAVA